MDNRNFKSAPEGNIENLVKEDAPVDNHEIAPASRGNPESLCKVVYKIEDVPEELDIERILSDLDKFKPHGKTHKLKIDIPEGPYVSIPKSDMRKILDIAGIVLENKFPKESSGMSNYKIGDKISKGTLSQKRVRLNFIGFSFVDDEMLFVRFSNALNYITIKMRVSGKGMASNHFSFFISDLKTYVAHTEHDNFIMIKDDARYKIYLFGKYSHAQYALLNEKRSEFFFSDTNEYNHECFVDSTAMRQILRPISRIAERRTKREKNTFTNRVHFCGNHAIVTIEDMSFFVQQYPSDVTFPECATGTSFVKIFSALLDDSFKGKINISLSSGKDRIKAITDEFEVSSPLYHGQVAVNEDYEKIIGSLKGDEFSKIDVYFLSRIVSYSRYMRLSKKILGFRYGEDGRVICLIMHSDDGKDYNYVIHLNSETLSSPPELEKPVLINTLSLKGILKAFEGSDNLGILIQNEQVVLKGDDSYAVLKGIREAK